MNTEMFVEGAVFLGYLQSAVELVLQHHDSQ